MEQLILFLSKVRQVFPRVEGSRGSRHHGGEYVINDMDEAWCSAAGDGLLGFGGHWKEDFLWATRGYVGAFL